MHTSSFGITNSLIFIKIVKHGNFPSLIWEEKKRGCAIQYSKLILIAGNVHVGTLCITFLFTVLGER